MTSDRSFQSLAEFYPYYLDQHRDPTCRKLHFTGTGLIALWIALAAITGNAIWLWGIPVAGYGFAWIGHAFFEKNRPATFTHPFYSLASDFLLFAHLLTGKEKFAPDA